MAAYIKDFPVGAVVMLTEGRYSDYSVQVRGERVTTVPAATLVRVLRAFTSHDVRDLVKGRARTRVQLDDIDITAELVKVGLVEELEMFELHQDDWEEE